MNGLASNQSKRHPMFWVVADFKCHMADLEQFTLKGAWIWGFALTAQTMTTHETSSTLTWE
jgi:hypothetical protein